MDVSPGRSESICLRTSYNTVQLSFKPTLREGCIPGGVQRMWTAFAQRRTWPHVWVLAEASAPLVRLHPSAQFKPLSFSVPLVGLLSLRISIDSSKICSPNNRGKYCARTTFRIILIGDMTKRQKWLFAFPFARRNGRHCLSFCLTATKVGTNPITGHPTPNTTHTTHIHTGRSSFDRHNYRRCLPLDAHPNQMVCFVLWQTNGFFFVVVRSFQFIFGICGYFPSFCFYSSRNKSITFLLFSRKHRMFMSLVLLLFLNHGPFLPPSFHCPSE